MLHLLEGNNGAGKTTYLDRKHTACKRILTDWLNPRRWPEDKIKISNVNNYLFGAYECIYRSFDKQYLDIFDDWWWDRTFISAYVYGSLDIVEFKELLHMYYKLDCDIYYLDVPWYICKKRVEHKDYKIIEDKSEVFKEALNICSEIGLEIHILKNVKLKGV